MKNRFLKIAVIFSGVLLINNTQAQTTIYSESFTGGFPSGWTKTDLIGGGNWQYTTGKPLNWSNHGFPGARPVLTTSSTGYMLFDSNGQNAGTNDNLPEKADLISPAINLLGYTGTSLEFEHFNWHVDSDTSSVWLSTDGVNYSQIWSCSDLTCAGDANTGAGKKETIDISALADNQPMVYIKFHWIGDYDLYWAVDDIKVLGNAITAIKNLDETLEINSYPNPVKDFVTIKTNNTKQALSQVEIFDVQGRSVKTLQVKPSNEAYVDLSDLKPGIYCLTITGSDYFTTKKIIKE